MSDLDKLIAAVEAGAISTDLIMDAFGNGWDDIIVLAAFDGSLDAAKRLHEALLPDYGYASGGWGARVWLYSDRPHWDGSKRQEVELPNMPARAWLLAVLRALRDKDTP